MKYPMRLLENYDYYKDGIDSQSLFWNHDNFKGKFQVGDLCECPEDAIIGRDLFTADDFIDAVRFGMDLAKKGYTDIDVIRFTYTDREEYCDNI